MNKYFLLTCAFFVSTGRTLFVSIDKGLYALCFRRFFLTIIILESKFHSLSGIAKDEHFRGSSIGGASIFVFYPYLILPVDGLKQDDGSCK